LKSYKQTMIDSLTSKAPADFVPLGVFASSITWDMMKYADVYWPEAHTDPVKLARLAAMPLEMFGIQSIKLPFDVVTEVQAIGCEIDFGTRTVVPQVRKSPFTSVDELEIPSDLASRGKIPVVLEAMRILKKQYPDVVCASHIMGAVSMASLLVGFDKLLYMMIDDEENFGKLLDFTTRLGIEYGKLLTEAGNDVLCIGEAAASGEVFSPETYREQIAPYHRRYKENINSIPVRMHICGNVTGFLPILTTCNIDSFSFDHLTNMKTATTIFNKTVKAVGNVDPIGILKNGTPADVEREVYQCMDDGVDVLSPGCALSPDTPSENIRALVNAHKKYLKEKRGITL
jgi:[methyl-Co(III) methanol-specific corrinoid protein]:coenzyme M methyltransferase